MLLTALRTGFRLFGATYLIWLLAATLMPALDALERERAGIVPDLADLAPFHYSLRDFQWDALKHVLRRDLLELRPVPTRAGARRVIREYGQQQQALQAAVTAYRLAFDLQDYLGMAAARVAYLRAWQWQRENQWAFERAVQMEVSDELVRAGIVGPGIFLPPVWFRLAQPPLVITFSPRETIQPIASYFLRETTPLSRIEQFETQALEQQNLSALVEPTGGVATYPATVALRFTPLQTLFDVVTHEWFHNYLTFRPLGIRYLKSTAHRTLNETAATLVGEEIAYRLMLRHYRDQFVPAQDNAGPEAASEASAEAAAPAEEDPAAAFNFRTAMFRTRLHVDALLAAGQVEEAEAYMEERRQVINAEGYALRKLNQAYFAFHGTYATRPGSSSDIGPKMEALRALSADLAVFVATVQQFRNEEDLNRALTAARTAAGLQPPD